MQDIFNPIPGFDDKYEITKNGLFKYLNYNNTGKEFITYGNKGSGGHLQVDLCKNGTVKSYGIHRLVALVYKPIPDKYKYIPIDKLDVHHDNFLPWDNRVENLSWVTKAEHMAIHHARRIYRYGLDGLFIDEWSSSNDIKIKLGINPRNVRKCCNGERATAGGFQFSYYKHDRIPPIKPRYERASEKMSKKVAQYSLDGKLVRVWNSLHEIQRETGFLMQGVSDCCLGKKKTYKGFIWKYVNPN